MSANSGLEGKESGDIAATAGTISSSAAGGTNIAVGVVAESVDTAMVSNSSLENSASTDNTKAECSSAGVVGVSLLTGFSGADIDDFVQRRCAEAASNDEEERTANKQSQFVDLSVDTNNSLGAAGVAVSIKSIAKACPTCGIDKNTVVTSVASSAEIMTVSSPDSNFTAASSSQSNGQIAATACVGSYQDSNVDGKECRPVNLMGSQGTENLVAASTTSIGGTLSQSPPDITDAILSASLYVIGALICAIVVRRLLLLFLLASSHIPDSDGGDL